MRRNYFYFFLVVIFNQTFGQNIPFPSLQQVLNQPSLNFGQEHSPLNLSPAQNLTAPDFIPKNILSVFLKKSAADCAFLSSYKFKGKTGIQSNDTIKVGLLGNDTLKITGAWTHTGPIFVGFHGVLQIQNASVVDTGDIVIFGHGKVLIESSTLNFPQEYFYQRTILMGGSALLDIRNSTLAYGGMVHSMSVSDTAKVIMNNVYQKDFMTVGLNQHASFAIDKTNKAGEFLMNNYSTLNLLHADTCLIWHDFPDTCVVNWSFGTNSSVKNYVFDKNQPGVKGIESSVKVDSSNTILWGMMLSHGGDVTIYNSTIRTIGLLFYRPKDSVSVNGFYDFSKYSNTTIPLSDRKLKLINDSVSTWSAYVAQQSIINISNCQLGEVISYNNAKIYGSIPTTIDGTGGHLATSGSSLGFLQDMLIACDLRTEDQSLLILVNSKQLYGSAEAIGKSILVIMQTELPTIPLAREGSVAWYGNISDPGIIYADSSVNINGYALIDIGPSSTLSDFKNYELFYQKLGDISWTSISGTKTTESRNNNLLGKWKTKGLAGGTYLLRLTLKDLANDSVSAYRVVTVASPTAVREENYISNFAVYPNPTSENLTAVIDFPSVEKINVTIQDVLGREEFINLHYTSRAGTNTISFDMASLPNGIYTCRVTSSTQSLKRVFIVQK